MKKIFYLILVLGFVFTACEPLDDINAEIDAQQSLVITGDTEYTLTSDDYATLGLSGRFNSEDEAKSEIPALLTEMFPHWGKNSSVLVDYQLNVGYAPVGDYTYADTYELDDSDYANAGADAAAYSVFTAMSPAGLNLPSILDNNIDAPTNGDIILAKYKYAEEPSDPSVIYTMINEDYMLVVDGVANSSDPAVNSLVSSYGDSEFYTGSSAYYANFDTRLSKRVGQADIDALATEEEKIALIDARVQEGIVWFLKGKFPNAVPEINGQTVFYAITYKTYNGANSEPTVIYKCTASGSDPVFELVEGPGEDVVYQASTITENRGDFYSYTGSKWEKVSGVYFIGSGDFDSMGEASGQPGRYNNFGSTTPPGDYLPTFLNIKYPYALEGEQMIVIYDYYSSSSGAQIRGDLYTKAAGVWSGFQSTISTTLQFGHDGNTWQPDNTIKYTLVSADYAYMASALEGNSFFANVSLTSLANYNDYDYNWSLDQIIYSLDVLLNHLDPSAADGQKYLITYLLYDNGTNDVTKHVIKQAGEWVWND